MWDFFLNASDKKGQEGKVKFSAYWHPLRQELGNSFFGSKVHISKYSSFKDTR